MPSTAYDYIEYPPGKALEHHVKFFYCFQGHSTLPERILPLGTTEITIRLTGDEPAVLLSNPGTQSYFVTPRALQRIIGICFQPWGLYELFHLSPADIVNSKLLLHDVLQTTSYEFTQHLGNKTTPEEIIPSLRQYLQQRVTTAKNEAIRDAVLFIDRHRGQVDLPHLYARYALSTRRLQQLFECSVGMSPKKYSQLKRFHYAVTRLNENTSLTDLALHTGYYDQSHFNHEFSRFAGVAPRVFLQENNLLNAINAKTWFHI